MKDAIFLKGASALDCIFHWTVGLGHGTEFYSSRNCIVAETDYKCTVMEYGF